MVLDPEGKLLVLEPSEVIAIKPEGVLLLARMLPVFPMPTPLFLMLGLE